jgi:ATP-dependent RNA helicase DDX3X
VAFYKAAFKAVEDVIKQLDGKRITANGGGDGGYSEDPGGGDDGGDGGYGGGEGGYGGGGGGFPQ